MLINAHAGFFDFVKENEKASRILFSKSPGDGFTARMMDLLCSGYIPVDRDPNDPSTDVIRLYIQRNRGCAPGVDKGGVPCQQPENR